ncbi:hypothetical protein [Granulicoccus phenolivorans]|uniref:hypothetical protein n=1 Tax=Granulicoccus phenolivorans TaxID=266854 RepID=UPI00041EF507|nr:hypothetical protein [Granulicoccus phenolivorans]
MSAARTRPLRPTPVGRAVAALLTVALLAALLRRLPVAVVICFDPQQPLYSWIPGELPGHCVTAPGTTIGGTLMVAATLAVQLVVLPLLLATAAVLAREVGRAHTRVRLLVRALCVGPVLLVLPGRTEFPAAEPVPVGGPRAERHPRRGPPAYELAA